MSGLSPVGVGVLPIIADHDMPLVGDMGGHPGDELQIIHRLPLETVFLFGQEPVEMMEQHPAAVNHYQI
jgi:hypothetical protein